MQTTGNLFEDELRKLINAEIELHKENAVNAVASADDVSAAYAAHRNLVGKIAGLRLALSLCDTARKTTDKR